MDLILSHAGANSEAVLELVREATGLGRAEAKHVLASLPQPIGGGWGREEGAALRRRFEEAGATVELR